MKFKSDKNFSQFISSNKKLGVTVIALIFGVLLILIGNNGISMQENSSKSREESIAELCQSTEGVGECVVHLTYREKDGEEMVYAVAIICEGAESPLVRERLTSLMCSLYGIGANRVEILKMKK